jgi:hypothetical protein
VWEACHIRYRIAQRLHCGGEIGQGAVANGESNLPRLLPPAQGETFVDRTQLVQRGAGCHAVVEFTQRMVGVDGRRYVSRHNSCRLSRSLQRRGENPPDTEPLGLPSDGVRLFDATD